MHQEHPTEEMIPGIMELKGKSRIEPSDSVATWLTANNRTSGKVQARFGKITKPAVIEVKKTKAGYEFKKQVIPLSHPLFSGIAEGGVHPSLIMSTKGSSITGYLGLPVGNKLPEGGKALAEKLKNAPDLIGLNGFDFETLPKITNKVEGGKLRLGLQEVTITLGSAFSGSLSLEADDERVTLFEAGADVKVKSLADGRLELKRSAKGLITGKAVVNLQLPKNFSGSFDITWDGRAVTGEGKVGYQGEKLSGNILLKLMEKSQAEKLEAEKKAPAEKKAVPAAGKTKSKKSKKVEYVVFGEGDLAFSFTDWLNGTAHVIVDPKGFVTIIGKITPQKEFELFPQKDYNKKLFKVEARASYGIPVVGNIFIFANIGMDAFAKLGPAKFYNIQVDGTYSTDPEKSKSFSIRGSLNISAAAGLRLRGEAGVGLEILAHDIKAGAGINALAGIRGYAEATPIIGYREKPAQKGEDKKGEFFVRGEMEIAAQPFLGLSGDVFVEIDAPWWSPVPDKKWTWPLGGKEWPLGGSLGVGANIDYVFGSGKAPALEFKKVDFSADKFMTDLYSDKAKASSGSKGDKPGKWKEKNSKSAEPPSKDAKKGGAKVGEAPKLPPAKSKVQPGIPKKAKKQVNPNAQTAEGKKVKEYQKEATKKGKKPDLKEPKKGTRKEETADKGKKQGDEKWEKGKEAVKKALGYAKKTSINKKDLNKILKKIQKRKEFGFKELYAIEDKNDKNKWIVWGSINPKKPIDSYNKSSLASLEDQQKELEKKVKGRKAPDYTLDGLGRAKHPAGYVKGVKKGERDPLPAIRKLPGGEPAYQPGDHRGHLIGDRFGEPAVKGNLVPMHPKLNLSTFKKFENNAADKYKKLKPKKKEDERPALLYMDVKPNYPKNDKSDPESYRPKSVSAQATIYTLNKETNDAIPDEIPKATYPNPDSGVRRQKPVNLNTATRKMMETLPGIGPVLANEILITRRELKKKGKKFNFYKDLKDNVKGIDDAKLKEIKKDTYKPVRIRD